MSELISLRPYQMEAIGRMHNGCILCGGVGSGKSRTALGYFYAQNGGVLGSETYVEMKNPRDLYIITTAQKRGYEGMGGRACALPSFYSSRSQLLQKQGRGRLVEQH